MRNENGESRGFGFVSYQNPEAGMWSVFLKRSIRSFSLDYSASSAMRAMNGATVGLKPLIVRLHEPKQLRADKLAQRFGHPRTRSGATSPTVSEFGENSFSGLGGPHHNIPQSPQNTLVEGRDRGRRGSGSYFNVCGFKSIHLNPVN